MIETERFIILRKILYSDSDLVLHALNPLGQKKVLFARSALKSKKRFGGGVLEPTHFVRAVVRQAIGESGMAMLQEASLLYDFPGLRTDYDRLQTALHLIRLADRVSTEENMDSASLFDLLGNGLKALEKTESIEVLRFQFEVKFLALQGVLPPEPRLRPYLSVPMSETKKIAAMEAPRGDMKGLISEALEQYLA